MSTAAAIRTMLAAGLSIEQSLIAVEAMESEAARIAIPAKTSRQERNARYYEARKERLNQDNSDDIKTIKTIKTLSDAPFSLDKENPHTPKEIKPISRDIYTREAFEKFWQAYPKHEGRKAAVLRFEGALKRGVEAETIIAGAVRYAASKAGEEQKFTKAASVWLNGEHWNDEIKAHQARAGPSAKTPPFDKFAMIARNLHEYESRNGASRPESGDVYANEPPVGGPSFILENPY